jgi:hypothetical protein
MSTGSRWALGKITVLQNEEKSFANGLALHGLLMVKEVLGLV